MPMTPILQKEAPFDSVTAGQRSTLRLPLGTALSAIIFHYTTGGAAGTEGDFSADISEIRVFVDEKVKQRISGAQLVEDNKYNNIPMTAGRFPLFFERPDSRTGAEEDVLAIGTRDVSNITIEVDIDAAAATPTLELSTLRTEQRSLGLHEVVTQKSYNFGGAGWQEISDLVLRGGENTPFKALKTLTLEGSTVSEVEVIKNSRIIYKADVTTMESLVENYGKTRQSNRFHLDWFARGRLADLQVLTGKDDGGRYVTVNDFRIRVNVSGSGVVNLVQRAVEERI